MFSFDSDDHDVAGVLTRLGRDYVHFLCRPNALSPLRTVISIADRMPEIGKIFYETGPAVGIARVARYVEDQREAGILDVGDCETAAAQFLDSCQSTIFKRMLFNCAAPPTEQRINHVVGMAVRTFLAAYQRR